VGALMIAGSRFERFLGVPNGFIVVQGCVNFVQASFRIVQRAFEQLQSI
jgi:hypothetical protein